MRGVALRISSIILVKCHEICLILYWCTLHPGLFIDGYFIDSQKKPRKNLGLMKYNSIDYWVLIIV